MTLSGWRVSLALPNDISAIVSFISSNFLTESSSTSLMNLEYFTRKYFSLSSAYLFVSRSIDNNSILGIVGFNVYSGNPLYAEIGDAYSLTVRPCSYKVINDVQLASSSPHLCSLYTKSIFCCLLATGISFLHANSIHSIFGIPNVNALNTYIKRFSFSKLPANLSPIVYHVGFTHYVLKRLRPLKFFPFLAAATSFCLSLFARLLIRLNFLKYSLSHTSLHRLSSSSHLLEVFSLGDKYTFVIYDLPNCHFCSLQTKDFGFISIFKHVFVLRFILPVLNINSACIMLPPNLPSLLLLPLLLFRGSPLDIVISPGFESAEHLSILQFSSTDFV